MVFDAPLRRATAAGILGFALAVTLAFTLSAPAVAQGSNPPKDAPANRPMRDIRFVVLHSPGPAWVAGKGPFEQPGLQAHVDHYRQLLAAGKLALGGPHLDAKGGGMMIPAAGVSEAEISRFASEDPAVKSGLLKVEVRPWLIGMSS